MARKLTLCLITIITLIFATVSIADPNSIAQTPVAQSSATPSTNPQPLLVATPPTINAKAYVLMDANSGQILAQKHGPKTTTRQFDQNDDTLCYFTCPPEWNN